MFKRIDGENCSMNKIVHFIGFDGDGFSAAVKVWGRPDFIHKFFDKRSLGDIDLECHATAKGTYIQERDLLPQL